MKVKCYWTSSREKARRFADELIPITGHKLGEFDRPFSQSKGPYEFYASQLGEQDVLDKVHSVAIRLNMSLDVLQTEDRQ